MIAHHPEGDGETDGGEQQDGAERQAVQDVLHDCPTARDSTGSTRSAASAAALTAPLAVPRHGAQEAQRVLVAARAQRRDRFEALCLRRVGLGRQDGRARLAERRLDACLGFPGKGGLDPAERGGIARGEDGLRGGKALGRIGRLDRHVADRRRERAPQGIVDADLLEAGVVDGRLLAGPGDMGASGVVLVVDGLAGGVEEQPAVRKRIEDLGRCRSGRSPASSVTAFSVSGNLSRVKRASVSSTASARATPTPPRLTTRTKISRRKGSDSTNRAAGPNTLRVRGRRGWRGAYRRRRDGRGSCRRANAPEDRNGCSGHGGHEASHVRLSKGGEGQTWRISRRRTCW